MQKKCNKKLMERICQKSQNCCYDEGAAVVASS